MPTLAIWIGKTVYYALKLLGRRGSALPGLVVEKLFPDFLRQMLNRLPEGVVVITGTNGKTTSTKMLTHVLKGQKRVLTNSTGSNFTRGIVASIIHRATCGGRLLYDIAVLELDEAYAAKFVDKIKPRVLLVTNIMRDQMDRFGEIDYTARLITKVANHTTDFVVLNRDDSRVAAMAEAVRVPVYYFGVSADLRKVFINDDELHSGKVIDNSYIPAIAELQNIADNGEVVINLDGNKKILKLTAGGNFNIQNATAVCALALKLGIDADYIVSRITEVKAAFGRGEAIAIGDKRIILQLVKNPGGFRHALPIVREFKSKNVMIAINDDYADGRDVSWLWDVSFGGVLNNQLHIITSGTRAADMALRLRYEDIYVAVIDEVLDRCLKIGLENTEKNNVLIIFTTYTAMLNLRKIISKMTEVEKI